MCRIYNRFFALPIAPILHCLFCFIKLYLHTLSMEYVRSIYEVSVLDHFFHFNTKETKKQVFELTIFFLYLYYIQA